MTFVVVVVASHYYDKECHHQDHQNHHQDHQTHSGTEIKGFKLKVMTPSLMCTETLKDLNRYLH